MRTVCLGTAQPRCPPSQHLPAPPVLRCIQFMSLHNVGDYLLEVPTELVKRVPKEWQKVRGHGCAFNHGG